MSFTQFVEVGKELSQRFWLGWFRGESLPYTFLCRLKWRFLRCKPS